MINDVKLPVLSDPKNTLQNWSASLTEVQQSIARTFQPWTSWEPIFTFSALAFTRLRALFARYSVTNDACNFFMALDVLTTAAPASNFGVQFPLLAKASVNIITGMGFRSPGLPAGSPNNGVYVLEGAGNQGTVFRVDRSLFPASLGMTIYLSGYYEIDT